MSFCCKKLYLNTHLNAYKNNRNKIMLEIIKQTQISVTAFSCSRMSSLFTLSYLDSHQLY